MANITVFSQRGNNEMVIKPSSTNPVEAGKATNPDAGQPPVTPPAGTLLANPSALPNSKNGSTGVQQVVHANLAAQPAGYTYSDGVSGVTVLKVTSNSFPNSGNHGSPYATGGPHCSQQWLNAQGKRCYTFTVLQDGGTNYFVDLNWDDMVVLATYPMPAGGGEVDHAFSLHPSRKRICFLNTGGTIRMYNTETRAYADSGIFPVTVTGGSNFTWLQTQVNDTWIMGMFNSNHTLFAVNTETGQKITLPNGTNGIDIDEPHLDLTEPFVYLSQNGNKNNIPWDLSTNTLTPAASFSDACNVGGGIMSDDHATPVRGGMAGGAYDGEPYGGGYYYNRAANQKVRQWPGWNAFCGNNADFYTNGYGNAFGFQGGYNSQWWLMCKFINDGSSWAIRNGVIAYISMLGPIKFLVGHQNPQPTAYFNWPRVNSSPDGLFVYWGSNMNGSGQFQILGCKVPSISA